jgi:4-amino-4-deoxy-L-arabinose transferase-like glycosyltransferase
LQGGLVASGTSVFRFDARHASQNAWRGRVGLLFLAALIVRLAFVALEPPVGFRGDERLWLALALDWVAPPPFSFNPLRSPLLFYPPLYPYLIAAIHAGGGLIGVKVAQALLGAGLVPAVACAGRRTIGPAGGLVASAFAAFYPTLIWYSAHFWSEPLFLLLLWWGLERALAADEGSLVAAAASGLLLGLAALTREVPLYFLPIVFMWMASRRDRRSLVRAAVLAVALLGVVAPWTLRNWVRFSAFIPVSTMGGRALWEGNAPEDRDAIYAEHDRLSRKEGQVAAYQDAVRQGLRAIRDRQPLWIFDKTVRALNGLFSPENMILVHIEKRAYGPPRPWITWVVAVVTVLPYLAVMVLFIVGLVQIRWNRSLTLVLLFFAFYLLIHVVAHGHHRFRLALLPVVFTVGASALPGLGAERAPWTPRRRLVAAALFLAFGASTVLCLAGFLTQPAFLDARQAATLVVNGPDARARALGAR